MTIITRCPHCKTTFNVADAILSKYKGLVRCASCSNVFNAVQNEIKKNVQDEISKTQPAKNADETVSTATLHNSKQSSSNAPLQSSSPKPASVSGATESSNNVRRQQLVQSKPNSRLNDDINEYEKNDEDANSRENQSAQKVKYRDIKHPSNNQAEDDQSSNSDSITKSSMPISTSIFEKIKDKLSFLKVLNFRKNTQQTEDTELKTLVGNTNLNKRLNKLGESKKKRPLFILFNIILSTILIIQFAYWQKDNIANYMPSIAPALKLLAKAFGGHLAPLKLKDNPVVSFSDMQKDLSINANRYILNVGLQNRFAGEAAMPSLEISLFDLNEQIITRRVFHPQVFLKPADWKRLEVYGLRANEELPIKLRFETNQAISSFKVVVFYP